MHPAVKRARERLAHFDDLVAEIERDRVRRERHENNPCDWQSPEPEPVQPASEPEPTEEAIVTQQKDWSAWDAWAKAHVREGVNAALEHFAIGLGKEVGEIEKRIRQELRADFEIELGQLRADLAVQRAADRSVPDLASWRAAKHDAA